MPCTTILVGKKASHDGSTIIARNDDGGFDCKKVVVVTPDKQPRKYKVVASHLEIELPENPLRFTKVPNVSKENGIWPACGINSANVAMTASETITTNSRVMGADPYVVYKKKETKKDKDTIGGIGEEDIVELVLPYVKTAREGVLRLGTLLKEYGTYEPNGIAFCDTDEVWWLETIGGHHWIAAKVPEDGVVIMPNQFGLDNFDFADALGKGENYLCSDDLKEFMEKYHLNTGKGDRFNPRLAFGSRKDGDHIYNTPRAWFMARYFQERTHKWDGPDADYTPESNDIPWCVVPERKVTVEDVRYLLGSYYQGTPYNPYDSRSDKAGKYRAIGVPNSDVCGILQIRGYLPDEIKGVHWYSLGGSGFTACFPFYANVDKLPEYISKTTETVSTEYMYWTSRIIAALTDAHYSSAIIQNDRYRERVSNKGQQLLNEYDAKILAGESAEILLEANDKIIDMVKKESDKALANILGDASEHMKTRFHRGDN